MGWKAAASGQQPHLFFNITWVGASTQTDVKLGKQKSSYLGKLGNVKTLLKMFTEVYFCPYICTYTIQLWLLMPEHRTA
jgi:hypothetical protein